jgi:3-hydroxybutyryl-CoA dehydrogenase
MGHIGNRLQHALLRECFHLMQSGVADAQNIDKVFRSCLGPRYASIGLIEYMETVGWDLQVKVESYLLPDLAADQRPQKILMDLYKAGTWGAKTNSGLYDWANKSLDEVTARQNRLFLDRVRVWKNNR